jgi:hypothetical protein
MLVQINLQFDYLVNCSLINRVLATDDLGFKTDTLKWKFSNE